MRKRKRIERESQNSVGYRIGSSEGEEKIDTRDREIETMATTTTANRKDSIQKTLLILSQDSV